MDIKRHDTVVIAASHPNRVRCNFERTDCDYWAFNEAKQNFQTRADVIFQVHREEIWRNPLNRNSPDHAKWLLTQTETPVIMQAVYPDVPASIAYPIDEIKAAFGPAYFTSSAAYAIALAALLGYKRIEIYGCEMATGTEYAYQRDGYAYWVGIARGRGIEVIEDNEILKAPLYGYEGEAFLEEEFFTSRLAEVVPVAEKVAAEYNTARGEVNQALTAMAIGKVDNKAVAEKIINQLNCAAAFGTLDGSAQELSRYLAKSEAMKKESGGKFLFSRQEFETAMQILQAQYEQARNAQAAINGAVSSEFERISKMGKGKFRTRAVRELAEKKISELVRLTIVAGQFAGAAQENTRALIHLDKLIKAAGGAKSEAVLLEAYK